MRSASEKCDWPFIQENWRNDREIKEMPCTLPWIIGNQDIAILQRLSGEGI